MREGDALVMDLSDVPLLGVTASLAIENAIRDAHDRGLQIYIVGASEKIQRRLQRLGLMDLVSAEHLIDDRTVALKAAVASVQRPEPALA